MRPGARNLITDVAGLRVGDRGGRRLLLVGEAQGGAWIGASQDGGEVETALIPRNRLLPAQAVGLGSVAVILHLDTAQDQPNRGGRHGIAKEGHGHTASIKSQLECREPGSHSHHPADHLGVGGGKLAGGG